MYNMNTIYVSSSSLKNNVSSILDNLRLKGGVAIVEKYGKPIATITPILAETEINIDSVLTKTFGSLPNFPDVIKKRVSRKKSIIL